MEETLGRRTLGALIDGALPVAAMWLAWELQDEHSRVRLALAALAERGRELRGRLDEAWRRKIVEDLIESATIEGMES